MIILDNPGAVTTEHKYLACPKCSAAVKNEGFGFVSCAKCDSVMLWESATELTMQVL